MISNLRLIVLFAAELATTVISDSVWGMRCSSTIDSSISFFCDAVGDAARDRNRVIYLTLRVLCS